jgi:GMP synthase (glutamine-hydrolysing)
LMARAPTGEVQAARHAPTVWGVQWHPEVDEGLFRGWLADGNADPALAARALEALAEAREELEDAWRPLAVRFASLSASRR